MPPPSISGHRQASQRGQTWQRYGSAPLGHASRRPQTSVAGRHLSWIALGCCLFLSSCNQPEPIAAPPPDPWRQMRDALMIGNWELARQHSQAAMLAYPNNPDVITDAAKAAAKSGDKRTAAKLMVDAATLANFQPSSRVDFAVQALIDVGEVYEAIELLERSLAVHPGNSKHRRDLVGFMVEAQRVDLIGPHYERIIRERKFDFPFLVAFTESSTRRLSHETSDEMMKRNPDDHRIRLGQARFLMDYRDFPNALKVINEVIEQHPNFAPAHALLGQILVSQERYDEIDRWHKSVPPGCTEFVDYWLTLGDWAMRRDQPAQAARAYWEATQRDINDATAWSRLAQAIRFLRTSGRESGDWVTDKQLADIDQRVADLFEARKQLFNFLKTDQTSQRCAVEAAKALARLGRYWEAEAWSAAATNLTDDLSDDLDQVRRSIVAGLKRDKSWISTKGHPSLRLNLANLPSPKVTGEAASRIASNVIPARIANDHLRLSEEADRWGLQGIGQGNSREDARLGPLIRSTGVGGGAIDYDLDGRADLLVMGAGGTMLKNDSFPNELMRNLGDRFARVSRQAAVDDTSFGQGVGVGDYNEDGFPDLFFANLGKNRLLRNNGDGTFTDATAILVDGEARDWTTCGAFMDVDQDGISDLITTNYVEAVENLDRACPRDDGTLGPCHPLKFPAYRDQFFAGSPDGQLRDVTRMWVPQISPGRGLGILGGSLSDGQFGLFIANDMTVNEFYTHADDGSVRLTESAAVRGVAVDARTLPQASMGIASGDMDGDGDLDMYVTGFGKEYNIYYEQISPGLWKDESGKLGLIDTTLNQVGFGTEAIDLDNDGIDELAITNGHVGDFENDEVAYEQPFQLFRRGESGKFELVNDDRWGDYFTTDHVGRALWTFDANGDGRNDFMLTHVAEQVRLMINRTTDDNHHIALKLIGRDCSRDAIGAVVRFNVGERQKTLWCLAGHGYLCSNEQVLRAGLGEADQVENVTITWQDGSVEEIGTLQADSEYVIVQGDATAFQTRSY